VSVLHNKRRFRTLPPAGDEFLAVKRRKTAHLDQCSSTASILKWCSLFGGKQDVIVLPTTQPCHTCSGIVPCKVTIRQRLVFSQLCFFRVVCFVPHSTLLEFLLIVLPFFSFNIFIFHQYECCFILRICPNYRFPQNARRQTKTFI
jgi:hypothetical protein